MTVAPCSASASAHARPMPREPPVTRAIFPSSRYMTRFWRASSTRETPTPQHRDSSAAGLQFFELFFGGKQQIRAFGVSREPERHIQLGRWRDHPMKAEREARRPVVFDDALDEVALDAIEDAKPLTWFRFVIKQHELARPERAVPNELFLHRNRLAVATAHDFHAELGGAMLPRTPRGPLRRNAELHEPIRREALLGVCRVVEDEFVESAAVLLRGRELEQLEQEDAQPGVCRCLSQFVPLRIRAH